MNDMLRRQVAAFGNLCIPRRAAAQCAARLQQSRPGRPMDRPIHTTASEQRGVGGINNRIDLELRNIAFDYLNHDG